MKRERLVFISLVFILGTVLLLGYYNLFTCTHCNGSKTVQHNEKALSHCAAQAEKEASPDFDSEGCALSMFSSDESDYLPISLSNSLPFSTLYTLERVYGTYVQQAAISFDRELRFFKGRGSIQIIKTIRLLC